jgi:hypothetical protein
MRSTRRTARRASGAAAAASRASCGRVTIARNAAGSQPAKMAGTTASDNLLLGPARPRNSLGQPPPHPPRHSFGSAFSPNAQESILEMGVGGAPWLWLGPNCYSQTAIQRGPMRGRAAGSWTGNRRPKPGNLELNVLVSPRLFPEDPLMRALAGAPGRGPGAPTTPLDTQRVCDFTFGGRITSRLLFP